MLIKNQNKKIENNNETTKIENSIEESFKYVPPQEIKNEKIEKKLEQADQSIEIEIPQEIKSENSTIMVKKNKIINNENNLNEENKTDIKILELSTSMSIS